MRGLTRLVHVVFPLPLPLPVCRDPDDDAVLVCAVAARASIIVSGDNDLLSMERYEGIAILNARDAIALIGELKATMR
ncbi:MAG: putative toxin-antitoxin system toxin component, PIN family [Betaproteobacteria bacterium]|nr:MAG: putative toxin-antitoxin system toxin component, PIN family [Betaproteobacteria bacterium]TAG47445.1 MAG: putative toxin-antitoxin system toxin component, PIN family [Betaproteobacteria bacterium]